MGRFGRFGLGGRRSGGASAWDGVDYLDLVPVRCVAFEERPAAGDAAGQVVLLVPRYRDPFWGRVLQPRLGPAKRFVRVPLEARGSALWRGMDGRATVRDLLPAAAAAAPADDQGGAGDEGIDADADLARRVCLYLQALVDNGFVAVALPGDGEDSGT